MRHYAAAALFMLSLLVSTVQSVAFDVSGSASLLGQSMAKPTGGVDWDRMPMDGPIDGSTYKLGPGDELSLITYGSVQLKEKVIVESDGYIWLPGINRINVNGLTLNDLNRLENRQIYQIFKCDSFNFNVDRLRKIRVRISGAADKSMEMDVKYTSRLNSILEQFIQLHSSTAIEEKSQSVSLRNVKILRGNDSLAVDFLAYLYAGDEQSNPILEAGDHILLFRQGASMRVSGPFRQDIQSIEFRRGDTPEKVIGILGGVHSGYQNPRVNVVRRDRFGIIIRKFEFDLTDIAMDTLKLAAWDQLYVVANRSGENSYEVYIFGEVMRPGYYAIDENKTSLLDIFTMGEIDSVNADLDNTIIERKIDSDPEMLFINKINDMSSLTWFERSYAKSRLVHSGGTLILNNDEEKRSFASILLKNGDRIYVPRRTSFIEVLGAVRVPGFAPYKQNWRVADYIEAAGGKLPGVSNTSMKVRRAGTVQFVTIRSSQKLYPGDVVMIPFQDEMTGWDKFKEGLSVTVQLLSIFLFARSL